MVTRGADYLFDPVPARRNGDRVEVVGDKGGFDAERGLGGDSPDSEHRGDRQA